ncbi:hypothetical protein EV1_031831 [Malus domestica]
MEVVVGAAEDLGKRRRSGFVRKVLCDIVEELACGCVELFFVRVPEIGGSEQDEAYQFGADIERDVRGLHYDAAGCGEDEADDG